MPDWAIINSSSSSGGVSVSTAADATAAAVDALNRMAHVLAASLAVVALECSLPPFIDTSSVNLPRSHRTTVVFFHMEAKQTLVGRH